MMMKKIAGALLLALAFMAMPNATPAQVAVGISVHIGPPVLPVYAQPVCPGPGYLWTPGYWAYGPDGYFWVPGTWVVAPAPGLLWTPGYWGWGGGVYIWHAGYWGPHVGFYGGINYGYGYGGVGFYGGEWRHGVFAYNTAVTNVNTTVIHNTYVNNTVINKTVINNNVSYNGGTGGTRAQPTAAERVAEREQHTPATSLQTQHEQTARGDRSMLASENHGRPAIAATAKPGVFHGAEVVAARPTGGNPNRTNSFEGNNRAAATHNDRPPNARTNNAGQPNNSNRPNTGNPNYPQHSQTTQPNGPHNGANNPNANHPNNNHPNNVHPNEGHPGNPHGNPENRPPSREHEPGHPGR
jgi:hypothetical protein